jgi:hypothetical protein
LGRAQAQVLLEALVTAGMLTTDGKLQRAFDPRRDDFDLRLPPEFAHLRTAVTDLLSSYQIERHIQPERQSRANRLRKEVQLGPDFAPTELPALAGFLPLLPRDVQVAIEFRQRGWIHDGILRGDRLYFTAVNGQVIVMNRDGSDVQRYDLNEIADKASSRIDAPLGWCRGLEVLDDGRVVVGFSRMRQTKWKERVKWAKSQLGRDVHELYPTRVVTFDLERRRQEDEIDLEGAGINAIFSVHRLDTGGVTTGA